MFRSNLRKLWLDGEGRLLLINLANQIENGVIGPGVTLRFLDRAAAASADFSSRGKALQYQRDDLSRVHIPSDFFKGSSCSIPDDTLILRIAPFKQIVENVVFLEDGARLQAEMLEAINELLNLRIGRDAAIEAENSIRDSLEVFARGQGSAGHWNLPPQVAALGPVACSFGRRSLRYSDKASDVPVFVAPLPVTTGSVVKLFGDAASGSSADLFRDRLGLDHLGASYKDSRTVIGGMLMRASQLNGSFFHRPTPFDNTSRARFRGAHGDYGSTRGSMGRAADLTHAHLGEAKEGCVEVVAKDLHITSKDREVLIFYLGAVLDPRRDAYDEKAWGSRDDAFASACLGGGRVTRALARIVLAGGSRVAP